MNRVVWYLTVIVLSTSWSVQPLSAQGPTLGLGVSGIVESTEGGFKFPDGTVQVTSAIPSTIRSSILAESMRPIDSSIGFDSFDARLKTVSNSTINSGAPYIGQINLPDGVVVQNATCQGFDTAPENIGMGVFRYRHNGDGVNAFETVTDFADSSGISGDVELTSPAVDPPPTPDVLVIDNENYSYGLFLSLPAPSSGKLYVVRCVVRATSG